ncbi:MAG: DUF4097 domain-containing protein [Treponema sp.]|jgi:DUF4097 and DUF4098 domain-containing protein YvlB|nr:DUF4097 domain-containing protein [Treponema sp.]
MTKRTRIFIRLTGILLVFTGSTALYSKDWRKLVNEESRPLTDINRIVIDYGDRDLVFVEGSGENLIIRDFMFRDRKDDYSVMEMSSGGALKISRAERRLPFFFWFARTPKSEIYIPPSFRGDFDLRVSSGNIKAESRIATAGTVNVELRSGDIRMRNLEGANLSISVKSGNLNIDDLRGDSTVELSSGNMRVKNLEGENISISVRSGNLDIDNARGDCTVELKSGDVTIGGIAGRGSYSVTSGNIRLKMTELSGNQSFDVRSGNITLTLPQGTSYNLDAASKSGNIKIRDSDLEGFGSSNSIIVKSFGSNPVYTIKSRVSSGNFEIRMD